jgi:hypothetical protein
MLSRKRILALLFLGVPLALGSGRAEVIYDNTQFLLSGYAGETREYGDQLDLEGTARTVTELTFYYYGDFVSDGDEGVKVRLYSNETPYDLFRQSPTKLLYESGNMPIKQGYNIRTINKLNIKIPGNTVTVTFEFKGLTGEEVAGVLLYGPPTIGSSFNEFWGKSATGSWSPFLYSTTDPARKANGAIKLVAKPEAVLSDAQTNSTAAITLRDATQNLQIAQTFRAEHSGKLERASLSLESTGSRVQLSILDCIGDAPGTNVLASQLVEPTVNGVAEANFYDGSIFLKAGTLYALAVSAVDTPVENLEKKVLVNADDPYPEGQLWSRENGENSTWSLSKLAEGTNSLDGVFSIQIVPADPAVRIKSPGVGELVQFGKRVPITIETNLPSISTIWRVRFFDGNQEIDQVTRPPYEVQWHATNSGPHTLRVVVEDTFGRPFRAEPHLITVSEPPPVPDERFASVQIDSNHAAILRFKSKQNEKIHVEYSDDLREWKRANDELDGTGDELSYVDDGPPKTERHPKESAQRYYRLIFAP